ncbi:MAG: hypothetical protein ACRBB6_04275 [Neptuniibacter sp.]
METITKYIHEATGEHPVYKARIIKRHPEVNFPKDETKFNQTAETLGYFVVEPVTEPVADVVTEGNPVKVDGQYKQVFESRSFTDTEWAARVQESKAQKIVQIEEERKAAIEDVEATVSVGGITFQADPYSMDQLNDALTIFTALGGTPEGYEWRDITNTNHPADLTLLAQIAAARAADVNTQWQISWTRKDAVNTITDLDRTALDQIEAA